MNTHCTSSQSWHLDKVVQELRQARQQWRSTNGRLNQAVRELPSQEVMKCIMQQLCQVLFPMRLGPTDLRDESEDFFVGHTLDTALNALRHQVDLELRYVARHNVSTPPHTCDEAHELVQNFALALPALRVLLDTDVMAAFHGDPAARSVDEVLLCYPGILAIIYQRLAHHLFKNGLPLLARIITELAHSTTGIDIHPGAQIGAGFFIDHGTGVVIGETAIIGQGVRLYQAVTLGAKSFPADDAGHLQKGLPRHPIIEDNVVIYSGATVLGRVTIGKGSIIGGNVWLTRDVPPGSVITQANLQSTAPDTI